MSRNTRPPWRITYQHLHNNNKNKCVVYSEKGLWVCYIGGDDLAESTKGRYILTRYEGQKNQDKGTSSAWKTPTTAPRLPSSVWKALWHLALMTTFLQSRVWEGGEEAFTLEVKTTWGPISLQYLKFLSLKNFLLPLCDKFKGIISLGVGE